MKNNYTLVVVLAFLISVICFLNNNKKFTAEAVRKTHKSFLDNSPFVANEGLTKKERKAKSLPPNAYFEDEWELAMNPELVRPTPEKLEVIPQLMNSQISARVPGDASDNNWISRG